jgi:site-specific DNA-methyltransferase (adenine-specific)
VFVDPPYNIGFDYGSGSKADSLPPEEYLLRMTTLARECIARLSDTGSIWFLVPERWADEIGSMLKKLLPRRNRIIWRETFGQYRETVFPSGHRHLFWHVKDPKGSPFYTDAIRVVSQRMRDGDKRAAGPRVPDDVWRFPRLVGNAHERIKGHPCQLPETLLERVILASTSATDTVLDPMAGTGTTLRVAQRLGRRYVGIEEQDSFLELIARRLDQHVQHELF